MHGAEPQTQCRHCWAVSLLWPASGLAVQRQISVELLVEQKGLRINFENGGQGKAGSFKPTCGEGSWCTDEHLRRLQHTLTTHQAPACAARAKLTTELARYTRPKYLCHLPGPCFKTAGLSLLGHLPATPECPASGDLPKWSGSWFVPGPPVRRPQIKRSYIGIQMHCNCSSSRILHARQSYRMMTCRPANSARCS